MNKGDRVQIIASKYHRDYVGTFWYFIKREKDDCLLAKYKEDAFDNQCDLAMHFSRVISAPDLLIST